MLKMEIGMELNLSMKNNKTINPIILHNSPSGAIERVIYTLLGKNVLKTQRKGRKPMFPPLACTHTSSHNSVER